MRPKNAIGKTLFLQPIVPLKPNPDHHRTDDSPAKELTTGRIVRERARARPRSAQNFENPPLEVAPTQTTVGSSAPLCSGLRRFGVRALKRSRKRLIEIFRQSGLRAWYRGKVARP